MPWHHPYIRGNTRNDERSPHGINIPRNRVAPSCRDLCNNDKRRLWPFFQSDWRNNRPAWFFESCVSRRRSKTSDRKRERERETKRGGAYRYSLQRSSYRNSCRCVVSLISYTSSDFSSNHPLSALLSAKWRASVAPLSLSLFLFSRSRSRTMPACVTVYQ